MIKLYKIRIGEKVYEVEVEEVTEKDGNIETSADSKGKQKIDKNENPSLQGETGKNEVIKAPMQGLIVDVKVKTGEKVKAGDEIIILEAMKMENPIVAPCDGVINEIKVTKGDKVNTDDVLAVLS
ncbi:Glutaconyl-CoA decarboxylase subunit gamma [uncultured Leptotrichia sp.]|uniref:acetyl-CoA carboxylase biotin carboxyl carrier protein subunit n=1 Tax=uncultured Leptotrichia sp. TaxID=159271 RepID=UPI001A40ABD6|nr:acetyl-CoA carboxylase biotin carboxyl carrier protein subunit [uncultured Leptotrichia sp.]VTX53502.1 Glutaconyl-CoA decarboxylase subunit gamma [uncultured Leptotrichia sp.]